MMKKKVRIFIKILKKNNSGITKTLHYASVFPFHYILLNNEKKNKKKKPCKRTYTIQVHLHFFWKKKVE